MELQIDYLGYAEQVHITNNTPGDKLWRSFYVFICDYIPISVVSSCFFTPSLLIDGFILDTV